MNWLCWLHIHDWRIVPMTYQEEVIGTVAVNLAVSPAVLSALAKWIKEGKCLNGYCYLHSTSGR